MNTIKKTGGGVALSGKKSSGKRYSIDYERILKGNKIADWRRINRKRGRSVSNLLRVILSDINRGRIPFDEAIAYLHLLKHTS